MKILFTILLCIHLHIFCNDIADFYIKYEPLFGLPLYDFIQGEKLHSEFFLRTAKEEEKYYWQGYIDGLLFVQYKLICDKKCGIGG